MKNHGTFSQMHRGSWDQLPNKEKISGCLRQKTGQKKGERRKNSLWQGHEIRSFTQKNGRLGSWYGACSPKREILGIEIF